MGVKLNQNGIQFNDIQVAAKSLGSVVSYSPYVDLNGNVINNRYTGTIKEPIPFVNAVDIYWGKAVLTENGVTIRTSGDLLHQIEVIYQKFANYTPLESIEAFNQQISEIDEKASRALELAQNIEQVNADWNANEGPAAILNKPVIPTSIYSLEDWNDFATQAWINDRLRRFNSAYDIYVEQEQNAGRTPLNERDWIESLHGEDGADGLSAYELAVRAGLTNLSETEWIKSLKAKDGWTAYEIAQNAGFTGTEEEWLASLKGDKGDRGKSNYDIYVELQELAGNEILSEEEWLASLKGEKGDKGDKGDPGKDGNSVQIIAAFDTLEELYAEVEGKYYTLGSAYLVDGYLYVYNDSGQTIQEQWRNVGKIKGPQGEQGPQGPQGKSNYDIYKELKELAGEEPLSEEAWLETLRGPQGKSNYDIYKELQELAGEEVLSEEEWLESLKNNVTYSAGDCISISNENVISLDLQKSWTSIN